jgi:hypothetical protein
MLRNTIYGVRVVRLVSAFERHAQLLRCLQGIASDETQMPAAQMAVDLRSASHCEHNLALRP